MIKMILRFLKLKSRMPPTKERRVNTLDRRRAAGLPGTERRVNVTRIK